MELPLAHPIAKKLPLTADKGYPWSVLSIVEAYSENSLLSCLTVGECCRFSTLSSEAYAAVLKEFKRRCSEVEKEYNLALGRHDTAYFEVYRWNLRKSGGDWQYKPRDNYDVSLYPFYDAMEQADNNRKNLYRFLEANMTPEEIEARYDSSHY